MVPAWAEKRPGGHTQLASAGPGDGLKTRQHACSRPLCVQTAQVARDFRPRTAGKQMRRGGFLYEDR